MAKNGQKWLDMTELVFTNAVPDADEYCRLRVDCGLSPRSQEAATRGLPGTLFSICLRNGNELAGMGRIIGDGGCNYEVVDIAVHPDFQRQGYGYQIMDSLMCWLRENAPSSAYVSLLADDDAPALYKKFGFEFTGPRTVGMAVRM